MLKLPDYFSLFAMMKEDGKIIVEADTAEPDRSIKSSGIIVAVLAAIFDYCVSRSGGVFTRESLLLAVNNHMQDPSIHREVTHMPASDEQTEAKEEPQTTFDGIPMPKFLM